MLLWLNPRTGLSGDMLIGALLDLGAPLDDLVSAVASTDVTGWTLMSSRVDCGGIQATRAVVTVEKEARARSATELREAAYRARPEPVAALAGRAIDALIEVEARLHDSDADHLHLHELSGVDTIVDVVAVAAGVHALGIEAVHSAPIALGHGTVMCAHGLLPVPAPATAQLLRGAAVELTDIGQETVTPTGAALLAAAGTRYELPPIATLRCTGYGAGSRVFPGRPNALQASLLDPIASSTTPAEGGHDERVILLETTVDDITGETLAYATARCLEEGALDVWTAPVLGKKGRPAQVVTVLCECLDAERLLSVLARETGTLGVRFQPVIRRVFPREGSVVEHDGHRIRRKSGPWRAKLEHDDLEVIARHTGEPLHHLAARLQTAAPAPSAPKGGDVLRSLPRS